MPKWFKRSIMIAFILGLILIIIMCIGIGGPHGPGRHLLAHANADQANPEDGR